MVAKQRLMAGDRGVAESLSYALGVGIMTILMLSLMIFVTGYVNQETTRAAVDAAEDPLQQVSRSVEQIDRLVRQSEGTGPIAQRINLPERLAGRSYVIRLLNSSDAATTAPCASRMGNESNVGCIIFDFGEERTVGFYRTSGNVTVHSTTVAGGAVRVIRRDGAGNTITIEGVSS